MNYVFTSQKYAVKVTESGESFDVPVHIALICDGDGNNKPLPPDVYAEFDGLGMGTTTTKTYFSTLEFQNSATLTVHLPHQTKNVTVKPETVETTLHPDGRLTANITHACNFVIQPDGDIFGGLHVFCNKKKDAPRHSPHVIEFPRGLHTQENSPHIAPDEHGNPMIIGITDDTLIYLADGAVVCADIELRGLKNVRITGTGILSTVHRCHGAQNNFADQTMWGSFRTYAKPSIYIRSGCSNIHVEGVTLNSEFRCVVIRNSKNITLSNVKMFSSAENADGINCYNTSDLTVDGCYVYSCDDCFCMYNACDSIPTLFDEGYDDVTPVCRNVEVKNCLMCSASRPFVLGGHATGSTDPRCLIENINVHHCYIIETPKRIFGCSRERELYWSGHLRILSQSEQLVRNIEFSDIKIHNTKGCISKPVHIEVRGNKNASYTESQGYRIENVTLRNIQFTGHTDQCIPTVIQCRPPVNDADPCAISGITFQNFTVNNTPISEKDMIIVGNVRDLKIQP